MPKACPYVMMRFCADALLLDGHLRCAEAVFLE